MSDEYMARVTGQAAGLMVRRQAPWVLAWTGRQLLDSRAFNPLSAGNASYGGLNALLLQSYVLSRGLDDARFVTARQAQVAGWLPAGTLSAGVDLHFVPRGRSSNEEPRVYKVHHVSEFLNVPAQPERGQDGAYGRDAAQAILARAGVELKTDQTDRAYFSPADGVIHMPPRALFADDNRYYALAMRELAYAYASGHQQDEPLDLAPLQQQLRAELAGLFIGTRLGLGHEPGSNREVVADWIKLMQADRGEFAAAAFDAQRITDNLVALAQSKTAAASPDDQPRPIVAASGATGLHQAESGQLPDTPPSSRTFLAVPFAEIGEARRLGAEFDRDMKVWWISSDKDTKPFTRWLVTEATLAAAGVSASDAIAEFQDLMREYGLVVSNTPIDDGKWHYVPTETSKGSEKNGSYVLDLSGIPNGAVRNFKTGEGSTWRFGGGRLTPEQRAAREAQAREQTELREREIAAAHRVVSDECERHFSGFSSERVSHPYLERKRVAAHGVRVVDAGDVDIAQVLNLQDADFSRSSGSWLVIPGRDVDGRIWTLQAIHSSAGGPKLFTKNARKKGAFHIIGVNSIEDLARAPTVGFAEGYATGASVFEATSIPVVVAFDSGNLVDAVKAVSARLAPEQEKLVFADNDQYFAEKLIERIVADLGELPAIPGSPVGVSVFCDGAGNVRNVALNGVRPDGEWHEAGAGKYRFQIEAAREALGGRLLDESVAVSATAEIVDAEGKMVRLVGKNVGVSAATAAASHCGARVVIPAFTEQHRLSRPTDFNDLATLAGVGAIRDSLGHASGLGLAAAASGADAVALSSRRSSVGR